MPPIDAQCVSVGRNARDRAAVRLRVDSQDRETGWRAARYVRFSEPRSFNQKQYFSASVGTISSQYVQPRGYGRTDVNLGQIFKNKLGQPRFQPVDC